MQFKARALRSQSATVDGVTREEEDGDVERAGDVESRGYEKAATRRRGDVVIGDDW